MWGLVSRFIIQSILLLVCAYKQRKTVEFPAALFNWSHEEESTYRKQKMPESSLQETKKKTRSSDACCQIIPVIAVTVMCLWCDFKHTWSPILQGGTTTQSTLSFFSSFYYKINKLITMTRKGRVISHQNSQLLLQIKDDINRKTLYFIKWPKQQKYEAADIESYITSLSRKHVLIKC